MFKLFKPRHRSVLGIDISSSSVKILEISRSEEGFRVEHYAKESLPVNALEGHLIKDMKAVSACIQKLTAQTPFFSKQVAVAVPDSSVISKTVQVNDSLSEAEMEELVIIEADKFIPYPIDEVYLDFEVVGPSLKHPGMLDVLIVASRAENVDSRVEAIMNAGLQPKIVDVESYAVERALQQMTVHDKGKIIAVIDIGTHYTHLLVFEDMRLIFSREEQFGGMQLIESIAQHYKISLEDATILRDKGSFPPDFAPQILEPFKELILLQVKRTLQFFYSSSQHAVVDHVVLGGSVAREPGLLSLIQDHLGVMATIANPFAPLSFASSIPADFLNDEAPVLLVSCGLALRYVE